MTSIIDRMQALIIKCGPWSHIGMAAAEIIHAQRIIDRMVAK